jgi:hypothetical protein
MRNGLILLFGLLVLFPLVHAQVVTVASYNVDPSPVIPGQTFTLYAYVYNNNGVFAKNVVFTLELGEGTGDTSFPFSIEPTDTLTRSLGGIPAYTTVQVQYKIQVSPDALDGAYTLNLKAAEQGKSGGILPVSIQVLSRKPILSIIQSIPTIVGTGQMDSIQLTIKNTGSSPAVDVLVSLKEDRTVTSTGTIVERDIVPLGASSQYIAQLGVNNTTVVNVPILVNPSATSKPYFVPVTLTYYDENKTSYSTTDYVGLKVVGGPNLEAIAADAEPLLVPGKPSRLTIDLFNNGLGPAKFVQARVQSDFFSIPTQDFFIGTIESDDFDSLVLDGVVSPSVAPGEYLVNVSLFYKNEFGDVTQIGKSVNVRVYSPSEVPSSNGENGFPLWIIAIVILGIGYWWFRLRKPTNGNGK